MDLFSLPPIAALLDAAYNALLGLTELLTPVAGAAAAAVAVILVTLLVRAALIPVGISQAKAEQARARIAPKLRALQERHKRNPERLQREMLQLYRDERTSPFAGILPVLAQAPIVGLIYAVFLHGTIAGHTNDLLGHTLFGVPLGTSLSGAVAGGALDPATAAVLGGVVVLIAVVAELSRRFLRPPAAGAAHGLARAAEGLHFVTAVVALFLPLAAALYLLVTVTWTLGQRLLLRRTYPLP